MSDTIDGGILQEVVIAPTLAPGSRRFLTEIDVAVLRDIGFSTITATAVPEPTSLLLVAVGGIAIAIRRRRRVGVDHTIPPASHNP